MTLWRNKLRASKAPQRIFDAVRVVIAETGVLAGKTRRAADSTVLDDAVARQDTIGMLVAQIRRVRRRATRRRTGLVGQRLLSIRRRLLFAMPTTGE